MVDVRIVISALWVALMMVFLLGDVLRIFAAALWVVFDLAGLPYKGAYDNFLVLVSFAVCGLIAWYAWTWRIPA